MKSEDIAARINSKEKGVTEGNMPSVILLTVKPITKKQAEVKQKIAARKGRSLNFLSAFLLDVSEPLADKSTLIISSFYFYCMNSTIKRWSSVMSLFFCILIMIKV